MAAKRIDPKNIQIEADGIVRVDGIPIFRALLQDQAIMLEICDRDRMRATCRGSRFVEIRIDDMIAALKAHYSLGDP